MLVLESFTNLLLFDKQGLTLYYIMKDIICKQNNQFIQLKKNSVKHKASFGQPQLHFCFIIKVFCCEFLKEFMESPLLSLQLTRKTLKQKIIQLCRISSQSLQKQGGYKQTKTFFVSQANQFIENLIHLHSKEVNLFIKKHLKQTMELIHNGTFQQVTNQDILIELSDESKEKNFQKEMVFNRLEKFFNFYLFKECNYKSKIQIQNVELQIQCSLNYKCPICIKQGEHNGLYSLKNIDNETNSSDKQVSMQPKTMKLINFNETKENDSFSSNKVFVERQLVLKLRQNEKRVNNLSIEWNTFGNLLGLQKTRFLRQNYTESADLRRQRLYKELQLRNAHNQKMIQHFCKKIQSHQKKLISRSLSVKHSQQINENQHSVPLRYFPRKKANSFDFNHSDQVQHHQRHVVTDRKYNILKPLSNLHKTIQFDRSSNLQNANRTQRHKEPSFNSRRIYFDLNSASSSVKKGRLLVPHDESMQINNHVLDVRATKKQILPHLYQI